jgi:hypothetical protein
MTTQQQGCADAAMLTTGLEQLDEALRHLAGTLRAAIAAEFDRLSELVAALPLTTDEDCLAVNWVAGARESGSAGDRGAARSQLRMIGRKLAP